jgi:hypothetical protein
VLAPVQFPALLQLLSPTPPIQLSLPVAALLVVAAAKPSITASANIGIRADLFSTRCCAGMLLALD